MKLEFSGAHVSFQSNTVLTEISWKYVVAAELFHTEGQTSMTKLTVAFRNFAIAPKNVRIVVPVLPRSLLNLYLRTDAGLSNTRLALST